MKSIKTKKLDTTIFVVLVFIIAACASYESLYYTDPVCKKQVEKNDSYDYKYKGETYHFHDYDCKQVFEMNPEKFISNDNDTLKKKSSSGEYYIDPVCNMQVDKENSFDYKYNGITYHFDNYDCKKVFEMNPDEFIKPKGDSIKH